MRLMKRMSIKQSAIENHETATQGVHLLFNSKSSQRFTSIWSE